MTSKYIEYKGVIITYNELEEFFEDMKKKREERDDILEDIAFKHEEIFVNYNKAKPPIDDNSLNFFKFKTIGEIRNDNSISNSISNSNKHLNFTLNNSLFHLLDNIVETKKEKRLLKRINIIESIVCILCGLYMGSYFKYLLNY